MIDHAVLLFLRIDQECIPLLQGLGITVKDQPVAQTACGIVNVSKRYRGVGVVGLVFIRSYEHIIESLLFGSHDKLSVLNNRRAVGRRFLYKYLEIDRSYIVPATDRTLIR